MKVKNGSKCIKLAFSNKLHPGISFFFMDDIIDNYWEQWTTAKLNHNFFTFVGTVQSIECMHPVLIPSFLSEIISLTSIEIDYGMII